MPFYTKNLIAFTFCLSAISCNSSQASENKVSNVSSEAHPELFHQLKAMDSLLFNIGFNQCNLAVFDTLVADDFEFYHDQSGITPNKEAFISGTKHSLCTMDYKAIRMLQRGSLNVFPMYNNGELYGALQTGFHQFYALYPDDPALKLTSEARFSHLWLKEGNQWKLARVISYDHHSPEE